MNAIKSRRWQNASVMPTNIAAHHHSASSALFQEFCKFSVNLKNKSSCARFWGKNVTRAPTLIGKWALPRPTGLAGASNGTNGRDFFASGENSRPAYRAFRTHIGGISAEIRHYPRRDSHAQDASDSPAPGQRLPRRGSARPTRVAPNAGSRLPGGSGELNQRRPWRGITAHLLLLGWRGTPRAPASFLTPWPTVLNGILPPSPARQKASRGRT